MTDKFFSGDLWRPLASMHFPPKVEMLEPPPARDGRSREKRERKDERTWEEEWEDSGVRTWKCGENRTSGL